MNNVKIVFASTMEYLIANVEHFKFDIEVALDEQYGALPLPFPGMDSMQFANITFYAFN